jgi:uncharacterized protein YcaQ
MDIMPAMNMRELRDTRKLKALLRAGKSVELRDRNRLIGRIVPETEAAPALKWPDFDAELKEIFGDRVLTPVDDLIKDREDHRW